LRRGFSRLAADVTINPKTAFATRLAPQVHPVIGGKTLNTICSHQKKFDGRFCLDIVTLHQARQRACASRPDFRRFRAQGFLFQFNDSRLGRECARTLVVHSTISWHWMNSILAQVIGFVRLSPRAITNPISQLTLRPTSLTRCNLICLDQTNFDYWILSCYGSATR
jgi:hypothetical protein